MLTIAVSYNFYQNAKTKDRIRFNNEINRLQSAIENKTNLYIALLKGGRGFIEANRNINRQGFAEYVSSLEMSKNYTGVQGIGYIQLVATGERGAFIEKMKSEGYADFNIFPAAEKDFYQVVAYLEPFDDRNRKVIGFDMSSESNCLETLNRAADSGEAATSAKVNLAPVGSIEVQPGFLIFLPIYKNRTLPARVEDRRKNISGFIYSPFPADRFLSEVQSSQSALDIAIKIYDGSVNDGNLLMMTTDRQSNDEGRMEERYTAQKDLNVTGRNWIVRFDSSSAFAAQSNVGWTPIIVITGIILSLLLFGMTYWETYARIKLQATAAELFDLQEQKQELLEKEQKARLSAEKANKTKDEFIAVVSHELRTPLNSIAGWTRILRSVDLAANTKNLALEKIEKNLRSQAKLVEELLDYSQIIAGMNELEGKEFNFSQAFEQIYSEIELTAQEKNVTLFKDNRLNNQIMIGDQDKIKLVIFSLLHNAVKFTNAGGRVEIEVSENDEQIQMIVRDDGKGISREFLPYIFDRFTQADSSTTRGSGGLGLGLTISYHIVKLHHGTIEARSEGKDKGAVFTMKIPHSIESGE